MLQKRHILEIFQYKTIVEFRFFYSVHFICINYLRVLAMHRNTSYKGFGIQKDKGAHSSESLRKAAKKLLSAVGISLEIITAEWRLSHPSNSRRPARSNTRTLSRLPTCFLSHELFLRSDRYWPRPRNWINVHLYSPGHPSWTSLETSLAYTAASVSPSTKPTTPTCRPNTNSSARPARQQSSTSDYLSITMQYWHNTFVTLISN